MDDDDFGDFGGFETAEPVAPQEAQQAIPSPWAVMPETFVASVQSDNTSASSAVPGSNTIPQVSAILNHENSAFNGISAQAPSSASTTPLFDAKFNTDFDLDDETSDLKQPEISQSDIPKSNSSAIGTTDTASLQSEKTSLQEITQTTIQKKPTEVMRNDMDLNISREPELLSHSTLPSSESGIDLGADSSDQSPFSPTQPVATVNASTSLQQVAALSNDAQHHNTDVMELTSKLDTAEKEKAIIQEEIQQLTKKNCELEAQLQVQKERLDAQIAKYDSVQAQHSEVLEDLRKAGHETLAVIVEEYKEVVKVALLQQQESCEKSIQEALMQEAEKFQKIMEKQQDQFSADLEAERLSVKEKIKDALDKQAKTYQESIEAAIKLEHEKCQESFQETLEEMKITNQKSLEAAVEYEREEAKKLLQKERESMKNFLAEEKLHMEEAVKLAVEEEHKNTKEAIKEAVKAEREKGDERTKEAVKETKEEMQSYLNEQRKADSLVRRRALTSIDLFMEGARKQINLLLNENCEKDALDSSS